jgi:ribosome maturation factor RimP
VGSGAHFFLQNVLSRVFLMGMRSELKEKIAELAQIALADTGLDLLDFQFVPQKKSSLIRLILDRENGSVSIDDCAEISRRFAKVLDPENSIPGSYRIEVSSPGFKRKIRIPKDFHRFIGHRVRLRLKSMHEGKGVWIGILKAAGEGITLDSTEIGVIDIPLELVQQANLDE